LTWQRETAAESTTSCEMQERARKKAREKEKREKFEGERVSGIGEKSRNGPKRASGYSSHSRPRTFGERFIMPKEKEGKSAHQDFHSSALSAAFTLSNLDRKFSRIGSS